MPPRAGRTLVGNASAVGLMPHGVYNLLHSRAGDSKSMIASFPRTPVRSKFGFEPAHTSSPVTPSNDVPVLPEYGKYELVPNARAPLPPRPARACAATDVVPK